MNVLEETRVFEVEETTGEQRIDKYLSSIEDSLSRSYLQKLIKDQQVLVNGVPVKSNYIVKAFDFVEVKVPAPVALEILPEAIPLSILYEDDDVIVIDKPKNMVVHPAPGHYTGTIVNALLYHCKDNLSGINGVLRPGIVHRIDQDTTGVIVVCKNDKAHNSLAMQLKEHTITRRYEAIVYHHFNEAETEGVVNAPIGRHPIDRKKMAINNKNGKEAITHYRLIRNLEQNLAHIECQLDTGRTHQIRVHMSSIHHPLLGDEVYGPAKSKFRLNGQTLHARVLGFIHPSTGVYMEFEAPLPAYFQELLHKLENKL
ncbi:RluA family pseudouridine synthase [Anaerosporobacter sp.]|uniref:RluA family pseudouridine synthase n=1 Tax=Anaerosporobacter sp. TaxID=1872529 RepID=UPI00286EF47B|nr:RluA family pseudouridine synthase [Anaerosporobacter sp.]